MQTPYDMVRMSGERSPDQLALVDDRSDRALTYRELLAEIDAVAAGLAMHGVRRGDRIGTVLPSLFDHGVALLALQRIGAVPALINVRLKPEEVAELVREGGLAGAIIDGDPKLAAAVADALPDDPLLLAVGGAVGVAGDYATCRGTPDHLPPIPRPEREAESFIFYTSGTTGLPKAVVLAHRADEQRVVWLSTQAGLRHGTHNRSLGFMPLSHCIGFYGVFLAMLAFGGTYYVMSAFDPAAVVDTIERHRINYLFAIPTLYHAITQAPNYAPERLGSLELVLYGGGVIDRALIRHIDEHWPATIRHIYGTTETMCSLYHPDPVDDPYALRPGFFSRVRAVRIGGAPDDRIIPGEEGELIVDASADAVFSGYLNRPDATAEKLRDGWYYTGDIVRAEDNGDVTLLGRVDDLIRSGGENIHPEEVEATLDRCNGVAESAVVGVPDPRWGQIIVACIVPAVETLDIEGLDAHCQASALALFKRPRGYVFLDRLPKNAAGKVLRRVLRDEVAAAQDDNGELTFRPIARA